MTTPRFILESATPPTIQEAIMVLTAGTSVSWITNSLGEITFQSGENIPTSAELESKLHELTAEWVDSAYLRNRAVAFAEKSSGEQFDMIYWDQVNGTTLWRDWVAGIKAAYPKPAQ